MNQQPPPVVDRSQMLRLLNEQLEIDPRRTAVITIDCHRGHLDPAVATMPVAPGAAASVADLVRRAPDPTRAVVGLRNHGLTITGHSLDDIFDRVGAAIVPRVPME